MASSYGLYLSKELTEIKTNQTLLHLTTKRYHVSYKLQVTIYSNSHILQMRKWSSTEAKWLIYGHNADSIQLSHDPESTMGDTKIGKIETNAKNIHFPEPNVTQARSPANNGLNSNITAGLFLFSNSVIW